MEMTAAGRSFSVDDGARLRDCRDQRALLLGEAIKLVQDNPNGSFGVPGAVGHLATWFTERPNLLDRVSSTSPDTGMLPVELPPTKTVSPLDRRAYFIAVACLAERGFPVSGELNGMPHWAFAGNNPWAVAINHHTTAAATLLLRSRRHNV